MAYDRVLGLPPQGLLGKALGSVLHPDDAPKLGKLLKEALLGNSYQVRLRASCLQQYSQMCAILNDQIAQAAPLYWLRVQLSTFRVQRANTDQWLEAHCSVTALPGRLLCIMKVGSPPQEAATGSASTA